jgi:hypothetical protein
MRWRTGCPTGEQQAVQRVNENAATARPAHALQSQGLPLDVL